MIRILGIEGMGDYNVIRGALAPLVTKYGALYQHCEWQDWQNYLGEIWDIVIGHSLGGDSAVRFVNKKAVKPNLLITCAARYQADVKAASWLDIFWPYDSMQVMTAPMKNAHNFWTYGPLPSAPMVGAVENLCVSPWYWHGNVPYHPAVLARVEDALRAGV